MDLLQVLNNNFTAITDEYKQFALEKSKCTRCSIYQAYKQVGQSEGNAKDPTFLFIGEALGKDEAEQVRPFIGRAGQRLRAEIRKYPETFNKNSSIITNLLSCRPENNRFPQSGSSWSIHYEGKKSAKRTTSAKEVVSHCAESWLFREIEILKPKIIVTLGSNSLNYVRGQSGITQHRGSWLFLDRFRAWSFATYHPSYVLRCANDPNKQHVQDQFVEDISKVAKTWRHMVDGDPRMSMTEDEWVKERSSHFTASNYLTKDTPIPDWEWA